ncbi:MAG: type III-A CRISPR-associated protein Csm2 [Deltaproteobacteria bacterium]|nr:type III-A CRISPR-associated protein Csm2 [Deltaproteobacteria bacterium]
MKEIQLWKDGQKGSLDPLLFSKVAEDLALQMKEDFEKQKKRVNKRTQLRKFYDEVLRLNMLARERPMQWDAIKPQVYMLTAKVAYAEGRELVSSNFRKFVKEAVDQVDTPEDLNVFSNLFEAFMGFYRLHGPRN